MKKIIISLAITMLLSGCATHRQYIERMDAHTGLHIDTVARSFGPPDRAHEFDDGGAMYQWFYNQSGSISYPIWFGGTQPATYWNVPYTESCTTTFYVNEMGYTTHYRWS